MYACSVDSFGNPSRSPNLPLFAIVLRTLHKAPNSFCSTMGTSRSIADHLLVLLTTCRPLTFAADQKKWSASHFYWSADHLFRHTSNLLQQRTKRGMAVYLKDMCAQLLSLSFHDLKGVRFSTLGPPTEHRNERWLRSQDCTNQCK